MKAIKYNKETKSFAFDYSSYPEQDYIVVGVHEELVKKNVKKVVKARTKREAKNLANLKNSSAFIKSTESKEAEEAFRKLENTIDWL